MSSDHDYEHALLEIRKRLHDPRGSKAAVFVGAGFSRNAIGSTSKHSAFPLWQQLTEGLVKILYPNEAEQKRVLERAGATSAALRLAQEFQTAFGRSRLIDFVRDEIRDDEFQPSHLHCQLLELPWADVFTTNYDRLLEKANGSLWKQHYDVVLSSSDLPLARRPRIVKLHGSLPALEHLVLTEEDYRNYRRNYAPFVATVQSALTENILCLIGFSGDDPNFLAWSGWLRDELRNAVPKTYLFTGDEMKPFQRQLLEERHIVPIPLKRVADVDRWSDAYQWLLAQLAQRPEKPTPSWNVIPQQTISKDDPAIEEEPFFPDSRDWVDTAILWQSHRQQYKGWYVLHRDATKRLWSRTESWIHNFSQVPWKEWPEMACIFVLYELIWRMSTSLHPLYDDFVFTVLDSQLERFVQWRSSFRDTKCEVKGKEQSIYLSVDELDDAYYFILQECLRHAREIGDDERFFQLLKLLDASHPNITPDALNERQSFIQYQNILHSLGRFKYADARRRLEIWNTKASAPIWAIRRAGLCLECGLGDLGKSLLDSNLAKLRSIPVSATLDIPERSCEGITLYLLAMFNASEELTNRGQAAVSSGSNEPHNVTQPTTDSMHIIDEPTTSHTPQKHLPSKAMTSSDVKNRYSQEGAPETSQQQIRERLMKLGNFGCNPSDYMEWLELATSPEPKTTQGYHNREGFDIGNVSGTMFGGTELQLSSAYEAMRFIEDAGLPLKMTLPGSTMTIAGNLFRNATKTIGHFAPHEAVGLVMRSRETKLVEEVFTRECLARLSAAQTNSLANATIEAIREAVSHLELPIKPADATDHFWEEQFQVASEAVGRIAMSLPEAKISAVLCEMIGLPYHPNIRDSLWRRDPLAKCVRRLSNGIGKQSAQSLLSAFLQLPVQGSSELPTKQVWYDPVTIVTDFNWTREVDLKSECKDQIDRIVASIAVARSEERSNLCHRAAELLCVKLLSPEQINTFSSSLYAHCDENGLPVETGCFDSLVLLLPPDAGRNELEMFRRKYLSAVQAADTLWRNLRRTVIPTQEVIANKQRNLEWMQDDLSAILTKAGQWLESIKPQHSEEIQPDIKQFWLNAFGAPDSPAAKQAVLCDWLATLENVIMLNRQASEEQLDQTDKLIAQAQRDGWCVTQAAPSRALLGKVTVEEVVDEIRCRLGDRDTLNVRQACDAMVRWCELGQTRDFQIPHELLQFLGCLVATRRHEDLPLLISVSTNVMERLDGPRRKMLFGLMESGLKALLSETSYLENQPKKPFTIGAKLRIRIACAGLAKRAADLGISCAILDQWTAAIKTDIFADVRQHLAN